MESIVLFREVFGKVFQKFVGTPHLPGNETQGPVILTVVSGPRTGPKFVKIIPDKLC